MKIQKWVSILSAASLLTAALAGCASKTSGTGSSAESAASQAGSSAASTTLQTLTVGASPTPHTEILEHIKPELEKKGYELKIVTYEDYVQPDRALADKTLDANYFQHKPYLDDYNAENKTDLVSAGAIHYEPLGIYPGKTKTLDGLKSGATVAIPNDTTNEARALLLLEANKLITLDSSKGVKSTVNDVKSNPKNLQFKELEAAQIGRSLQDVDIAVVNGNYAMTAGLDVSKDALAQEDAASVSAKTYSNIVAVRKGDEDRADIKALVEVLRSEDTRNWIKEKYKGSVVPSV